ncbi:MAG: monovalent cation/H+ antiporter subunit D family protein [Truepera sp.]|nr:monovalent cation/H+ antiporter subunit D family protein [Truepera sp.]
MNWDFWLPLLVLLSSLATGLLIFTLQGRLRNLLNLTGAAVTLVLVAIGGVGALRGAEHETRLPLLPGHDLLLRIEPIGLMFVALAAVLWFLTTLYAIGYLEGSPNRSRFFGFFSICITATMGIALSGNLLTFVIFFELLTLATYPLVVHPGTREAMRAGAIYLTYTLIGGAALLLGVIWLYTLAGPVEFTRGGTLAPLADSHQGALIAIFFLLIGAPAVKAALVPLHGWLPLAMVAPVPVSALLHAVAVVKAGAFGIMRVVFDVYGVELSAAWGLSGVLLLWAAATILYGSLQALKQDDLKRRLAYSTVSQLSYIALGVALLGPLGIIGGLVHLVHHGITKITLFFAAGNLAETMGIYRVSKVDGVGRRLPWSMTAFTVAAMGMIGLPPTAGFISKWYLALGGLEQGLPWIVGLLVLSGLLNAAYFLPVVYRAWFMPPKPEFPAATGQDAPWRMLVPTLATGLLSLLLGLFAFSPYSPLVLAQEIAAGISP